MQKHVTFVTRMGGGWGGRVPDLALKVACCLQSIWSRIAALPEIASLPCYFKQFSCFLVPGNIWASCVWAPGFSMGWYRADFSIRARLNKGLMTQAHLFTRDSTKVFTRVSTRVFTPGFPLQLGAHSPPPHRPGNRGRTHPPGAHGPGPKGLRA